MMIAYLSLLLLAIGAEESNALFFNRKLDCLVTEWSVWSAPYGFGSIMRERKILRYPQNGGEPCPADLVDEKGSGRPVPLQQTAKAIETNFITQTMYRDKRSEKVGQLRDLLIIMDSSGSITSSNFTIAKTQLARLVGLLCPSPDPFKGYQRAALIDFSDVVSEIFDFDDRRNTQDVQAGILGMPYMGQMTCTASAFNYARESMFTLAKGMRTSSNVKKEILILTDGVSNCGGNAIAAAKALKEQASVSVYALAIGDGSGLQELKQYVSDPRNQHLFAVDGYESLKKLLDSIEDELRNIPCAPFDI